MLPKRRRVTKRLFDRVMKEGSVLHSPLFTLRFVKESPDMYSHFAVVAPKSVAKSAHIRNSLRRKGYNACREIPIPLPCVGLLFFKKGSINAPQLQIVTELKLLFKKAQLLHE